MRWVVGPKMGYNQDYQVCDPQVGGISQSQRFSSESDRSEPHTGLPSLGILHQEDELPEGLAVNTGGAYIQKSLKNFKTETPLSRAYAKSYML